MVKSKNKPRRTAPRQQPPAKPVVENLIDKPNPPSPEATKTLPSPVPLPDQPATVPVSNASNPSPGRQCFRCQRWGHLSSTCTLPARCVKCSLDHDSRSCKKPREQVACCCNCKGSHAASYRGCPEAPKIRRRRRPSYRRPHGIPNLPTCSIARLNKVFFMLAKKKDFFTLDQWKVICQSIDDSHASQDKSLLSFVPRPVQLQELSNPDTATPFIEPAKFLQGEFDAFCSFMRDNADPFYFGGVPILCREQSHSIPEAFKKCEEFRKKNPVLPDRNEDGWKVQDGPQPIIDLNSPCTTSPAVNIMAPPSLNLHPINIKDAPTARRKILQL